MRFKERRLKLHTHDHMEENVWFCHSDYFNDSINKLQGNKKIV